MASVQERCSHPAIPLDPPGVFDGPDFIGPGLDGVRRVRQYAALLRGALPARQVDTGAACRSRSSPRCPAGKQRVGKAPQTATGRPPTVRSRQGR